MKYFKVRPPMVPAKLFNQVAQLGHAAAGMAAVFGAVAMGSTAAVGCGVTLVWAAAKEFWWDEKYEDEVVRGSGWEDFAFYMFGALLASAMLWIRRRF